MNDIVSIINSLNVQTRALLATFVITVFLGFIIIPILKKLHIGQVVRDDGPQTHLKKTGTPTMGGIIMLFAILIVSIVVSILKYPLVLPLALVTLGYGLVGFIDDFKKLVLKNPKGLSPKLKMLGLIIVSVGFLCYLYFIGFGTDTYIPILKTYIEVNPIVYYLCILFIMLACTNSLNLTDGLDGLAGGVNAIIMIFFTILAMVWGEKEIGIFSSIVVGASIGFLLFNINPARVFMGDTGSLALRRSFLCY